MPDFFTNVDQIQFRLQLGLPSPKPHPASALLASILAWAVSLLETSGARAHDGSETVYCKYRHVGMVDSSDRPVTVLNRYSYIDRFRLPVVNYESYYLNARRLT